MEGKFLRVVVSPRPMVVLVEREAIEASEREAIEVEALCRASTIVDALWYVRMCKLEIIYPTHSCGPLEVVLVLGLDPLRGFGVELINNPRTDSRCNPLLARIWGEKGF